MQTGEFYIFKAKKIVCCLGKTVNRVSANSSGNPFNFSAGPHGSPDKNSWVNPADGMLLPAYNDGRFGRWAFLEVTDPWDAANLMRAAVAMPSKSE